MWRSSACRSPRPATGPCAARQQLGLAAGIAAALLLALLSAGTARGLHRSQRARGGVEEQLRHQAHTDPLTGLANRRLFRERLTDALGAPGSGELAVLFADLDQFKTVNDTRGHAAGDAMLVEVAERLTDLLRVIPARSWRGWAGTSSPSFSRAPVKQPPKQLADHLVAALALPYPAAPQVPVTASIGLAISAADELDPGVVLRGADLAMYDAKSGGPGRWSRYAERMHTDLQARVELESQLRDGIPRGELLLHYQPTSTWRPAGRTESRPWCAGSTPGWVSWHPVAFVPLAERSELIHRIGPLRARAGVPAAGRVARRARRHRPGRDRGERQSARVGSAWVRRARPAVLRRTGLAGSSLVLEVTESTVMTEQSEVIAVLTDLRAAGVRIAIDDFGTGYSSLSRLHELPVDVIKIDRSFVHAAAPDDGTVGDTTMIELLVALAGSLRLGLVAEGIETPAQLAAVKDAGATFGQGFLLGRPEPAGTPTPPPAVLGRSSGG